MENSTKLKISSDFIYAKLGSAILLFFLFLLLTDYKRTPADTLTSYALMFLFFSMLLIYLFTRPDIYYDETTLYINKERIKIQVPLAKIQSAKFSMIGFGYQGYSYRIKYLNDLGQMKSVRIFSSIIANPISKFISCIQKQNPNIEIVNWSIGFNELID